MVSGPVSDFLNESTDSIDSVEPTFEQENTLENTDGQTLEIYRFLNDGVKMVSVNGFKLPLDSLLDMLGVEPSDARGAESDECCLSVFALLAILAASTIFVTMMRV
jgi:hypothetical protein